MYETIDSIVRTVRILHLLVIIGIIVYILIKLYQRRKIINKRIPDDFSIPKTAAAIAERDSKYWYLTDIVEVWLCVAAVLWATYMFLFLI